ncbi:hypothetical protein GCM10027089_46860 [Nocardia thraciensis]
MGSGRSQDSPTALGVVEHDPTCALGGIGAVVVGAVVVGAATAIGTATAPTTQATTATKTPRTPRLMTTSPKREPSMSDPRYGKNAPPHPTQHEYPATCFNTPDCGVSR